MSDNNIRFHIGQSALGNEPLSRKPRKAYVYSDDHRDNGVFASPDELEREIARRVAAGRAADVHRQAHARLREY